MKWVARVAVALVALQLAVRAVLAFEGYFYWDDLVLVGRAGTQQLWTASYLFDDHDGHVMPGAFLVAGGISRLLALNWIGAAASLVVLQLGASLALLRALYVVLGWRPVLLIPLTFALFTPLGLPAFAWWAAGLNALPMVTALAWASADAMLLIRTGRQRYAISGAVAYLGGLLFFEKAAIIPFVVFALCAVLAHVEGVAKPVATTWRRAARLWWALLAVTVGWAGLYLVVVDQQRWTFDLAMTGDLLWRSVTHGVVPGLVGGPWDWQRWAPASPWAIPPASVMVLGWLVLAAVLAVSGYRKERSWPVWTLAAAYVVACQVPIYLMRSSRFTALELAQTLRYLPDLVVVLAVSAAIGLRAPNRARAHRLDASPARRAIVGTVVALFVVSSLYSTATFLRSWRDDPTRHYLRTAQAALARANATSSAPLLDQEVDPLILQRIQWPENLASHVFALLRDRPEFAASTSDLRMLNSDGGLVAAQVTWVRAIVPGPDPRCGYLIQPDAPQRLPLNGPLLPAEWTAELNYLANSDGSLTASLPEGVESKVPVRPGLNRVFVRLSGAGGSISLRANTSALSVCVAAGPVGFLAPR